MLRFLISSLALVALARSAALPNIVIALIDDYGWANAGWHQKSSPEVVTPNLDALVASGIELNRAYAFMYCSPSRSALQSGRNPVHVNIWNDNLFVHNKTDPVSGFGGIPRNMTGLAEKLLSAGYHTAQVGKWHAGLATPDHTPVGRGYETSFGYLGAVNDYWDMSAWDQCPQGFTADLWSGSRNGTSNPAWPQINDRNCNADRNGKPGCFYEDRTFINEAVNVVMAHDPATAPLFLFWAPHSVHEPLEVPNQYLPRFSFINDTRRRTYAAMVNFMDEAAGNLTDALKAKGMWNNTLLVLMADNGGPVYLNGTAGANNWPLRGGKVSNWEGGVRVNAFVSGGFLPDVVRGTRLEALVAIEDWYGTFCALANVDPADERAAAAGLPPIDSFNLWPLLSGANSTPPRTEVVLGVPLTSGYDDHPFHYNLENGAVVVQGIVTPRWKLLLGPMYENILTGPQYPNSSTWQDTCFDCGGLPLAAPCGQAPATPGCLYDMDNDITESNNVAAQNPDVVATLSASIAAAQATVFQPAHGAIDPEACTQAMGPYRGVIGPWVL